MTPEWVSPRPNLDDDVDNGTVEWTWGGDESMHPFWAVRRLTQTELKQKNGETVFNLKHCPRVHTISMIQGTHTVKWNVTIPEYTSFVKLGPGTELLFKKDPDDDD